MKISKIDSGEIFYINILKIIACFAVIVNHTCSLLIRNDKIAFFCISFSLSKIGVPIFLLVTGTLIIHKEYNYKKIVKCISRVFIPMFLLSLFVYITELGNLKFNILQFLKKFLKEPIVYSYWYVYMLIGLYLITPFLQKMFKKINKSDYIYFLTIFLFIPTFIRTLNFYTKIPISFYFYMPVFNVSIGILLCGDFISKINLRKKYMIISVILFIVSFVLQFLSMYIPYLYGSGISYILDRWDSFLVLIMSISFFYIIKYIFYNRKISDGVLNIVSLISKTTFGIYLIHSFLLVYIYQINYSSFLLIILLYFGVFILSFMVTLILKMITLLVKDNILKLIK